MESSKCPSKNVENGSSIEGNDDDEHSAMTRKVLTKLDMHVLPPLALVSVLSCRCLLQNSCLTLSMQLWLANFLDRTNVGNAKWVSSQEYQCLVLDVELECSGSLD